MPKKKPTSRDKKGRFRTTTKEAVDSVAEWFRAENDRSQKEGLREWEDSNDTDSKSK